MNTSTRTTAPASTPRLPAHRRGRRLATRAGIATIAVVGLAAPVSLAATSSTAATTSAAITSATATPYCGITWGSLPEATSPALLWSGAVKTMRAGQHSCYDRLVLDVAKGSGTLGYNVRYVSTVTNPASGQPVAVSGGAKLQITVNAPATAVVPPGGSMGFTGWRTFRQATWVSSFEGYTDFGLGVRARLPMRAFTLDNADGSKRLVVDVAHAW